MHTQGMHEYTEGIQYKLNTLIPVLNKVQVPFIINIHPFINKKYPKGLNGPLFGKKNNKTKHK